MKVIKLEIAGNTKFEPEVLIDGKKYGYKKDKYNHRIYTIETDKNELDLQICKWHEEESDIHWLFSIIFFIISLFGIFDIRDSKNANSLKFKSKIRLDDSKQEYHSKIVLAAFQKDQIALDIQGDLLIEDNDTNKYFIDQSVLYRKEKNKKIKKYIFLSIFLLVIVMLALKFIMEG